MKVSVALCTFNGERFLQEQLDSISAQTHLPDEVVVGDDGSTDKTIKILETWAKSTPFPVRILINDKNLGPAKNFEAAILRCSGDIIFLSDQDDVWAPEKIEKMIAIFEKDPEVVLVYCYADTIDSDGKPIGISRAEISRADIFSSAFPLLSPYCLKHDNPPGCCSALHAETAKRILPIFQQNGHDVFFFVHLPSLGKTVTLKENLIHYRFHENNVSFCGDWRRKFLERQKCEKMIYRQLPGLYMLKEKDVQDLLDWLLKQPDSPYRTCCIRYVQGNQIHYVNRLRIQRNFVVFFPLWVLELATGRYFQRIQPVKSILYDLIVGLWNALNPVKSAREIKNLTMKFLRKIGKKYPAVF